jgi:adenylylsulfate reductase subunit A
MLDSKTGVHWKEVERAVQDMMDFYCNGVKTEQTLKRGIERIKDVRDNVFLKAENTHELMRCLEVRSIMDNAELVMRASIERKETRKVPFEFVRMDFPEQDDENWFAFLSVMFKDGKFKFSKIPLQHSN